MYIVIKSQTIDVHTIIHFILYFIFNYVFYYFLCTYFERTKWIHIKWNWIKREYIENENQHKIFCISFGFELFYMFSIIILLILLRYSSRFFYVFKLFWYIFAVFHLAELLVCGPPSILILSILLIWTVNHHHFHIAILYFFEFHFIFINHE